MSAPNKQQLVSDADRERQRWALQVQLGDQELRRSLLKSQVRNNILSAALRQVKPLSHTNPSAKPPRQFSTQRRSTQTSQLSSTASIPNYQPTVFRFDQPSPSLKCRVPTCSIMCTSERQTFICPHCGLYSYVRYCSIIHLLVDLRRHFLVECGRLPILTAIDDLTLGRPISGKRPYVKEVVPAGHTLFTNHVVERHRQAVYRHFWPDIDYFIFDDTDMMDDFSNSPFDTEGDVSAIRLHLNRVRGLGFPCAVIRLPFPLTKKSKLEEVVGRCLELGQAARANHFSECAFICKSVVEHLDQQGKWDSDMVERVAVQMAFEFGYSIPAWIKASHDRI